MFGVRGQIKGIERELINDLREGIIPITDLSKQYGLARQSIYNFIRRKGVERPEKRHPMECSICQDLVRISKEPYGEFLAIETIRERLGIEKTVYFYHIRFVRKKGLVSRKFGMLRSQKVERAYQIYFTKRMPVNKIGKRVGLKRFWSNINGHKVSGRDIPPPLFIYDANERTKSLEKMRRRLSREKRNIKTKD